MDAEEAAKLGSGIAAGVMHLSETVGVGGGELGLPASVLAFGLRPGDALAGAFAVHGDLEFGCPHQTMDPTALRWQEIKDSLDATVEEARTTPETARQLFNFCTMYRGEDDHIVREVRGSFTKLGIPLEYLSPMNDPHRL